MHAVVQNVIRSDCFVVMPQPKRLPKAEPPAEILMALSAQGAKIKLRKPNEDRVKRKPDWSMNANDAEWAAQQQLMAPPPPALSMSMSMPMPPPLPMSGPNQMMQLQQPYHMQPQSPFIPTSIPTSMSMSMPQYNMPISAQSQMPYQQQNMLMHHTSSSEMSQDFNFGAFQEPDQMFSFQGSQHSFGSGYGNFP